MILKNGKLIQDVESSRFFVLFCFFQIVPRKGKFYVFLFFICYYAMGLYWANIDIYICVADVLTSI